MIVSPRKIAFGCIFLLSKKIRQNFSGFSFFIDLFVLLFCFKGIQQVAAAVTCYSCSLCNTVSSSTQTDTGDYCVVSQHKKSLKSHIF